MVDSRMMEHGGRVMYAGSPPAVDLGWRNGMFQLFDFYCSFQLPSRRQLLQALRSG